MLLLIAAHSRMQAERKLYEQRVYKNTDTWCVVLHAPTPLEILTVSPQLLTELRRVLIHDEDNLGKFQFMWRSCATRQYYRHSFLCSNNGFFVDGQVSTNCPCECALLLNSSLSLPLILLASGTRTFVIHDACHRSSKSCPPSFHT